MPDVEGEVGLDVEHVKSVFCCGATLAGLPEEERFVGVVDEVVADVLGSDHLGAGPRGGIDVGVHSHGCCVDYEMVVAGELLGRGVVDDVGDPELGIGTGGQGGGGVATDEVVADAHLA